MSYFRFELSIPSNLDSIPKYLMASMICSSANSCFILPQIETLTLDTNSMKSAIAVLGSANAAEIEKSKIAIQATKGAEALVEEMKNSVEDLQGEIKRLKRCTDSQSRDLKRVIREKDALEKALQVSTTAAAEAATAAASAAASAAATRRNSDCPPFQVERTVFCVSRTLLDSLIELSLSC
jgi:TolA-binding protein